MIIETLILSALAFVAGWLIGKHTAKTLRDVHYKGWSIDAWKGCLKDKYYITAKKDDKIFILSLDPNNIVDFNAFELRDNEQKR